MPRPGPRPYECHRRAWHSDRHQPMRGSLIQEMFRVANEIHTPQTKKNREWQEKLPTVVLKAEEIMYSKANSEAEYMDFQTLWERTNDAINTIIRREETTETGCYLQPCIEAALILGCTVRRASRSQRNSNPRSYLSPNIQETTPGPPRVQDNVIHGGSSSSAHLHPGKPASAPLNAPRYSSTTMPSTTNLTQLHPASSFSHTQDSTPTIPHVFPFLSDNFPASVSNQASPTGVHPLQGLGHVYPLYYGAQDQTTAREFVFQPPQSINSDSAVFDASQAHCIWDPHEKGSLLNLFTYDETANALICNTEVDIRSTADNPPEIECDLALRLGPVFPHASTETSCMPEVEDIGFTSSEKEGNSSELSPGTTQEFTFFPRENAKDSIETSSRKWTSKGKGVG